MIKLKNNLVLILYSLVFLFPSFQIISYQGKGIPNSFLIISIFFIVLINKQLKKINTLTFLFSLLIFLSILLSYNFSLYNIIFAFFPFLIILCDRIKPIGLKNYGYLILSASFINFLFCMIQTLGFDIRPSNINIGYSFQDAGISAIYNYLPFSIGRLPGMFNENAPMVLHLILYIIETLRIRKYLPSLKLYFNFSIIINTLIIILTGSKLIIALPFILFLYLIKKPNFEGYNFLSKEFIIYTALIFIFLISYTLIINYFFNFIDDQVSISGLKSRFEIPENIPFLIGEGLKPSIDSTNDIKSLNGIIIYSFAWGILPATIILTTFFTLIFSKSSYLHLILLFLSIITSGSLLFPIYLEILLGIRVKPNIEKRIF